MKRSWLEPPIQTDYDNQLEEQTVIEKCCHDRKHGVKSIVQLCNLICGALDVFSTGEFNFF